MAFDPARFRHVLGHCPTPVTVITAAGANGPVGLTVGAFTSVSLEPPLVGFFPGKKSDSWPAIEAAGSFCVNVLAADQAELCWRFASEVPDKFDGIGWSPAPGGDPILDGALAWLDCAIDQVVEAGDHWFVLGLVRELGIAREDAPAMVFFKGKVGTTS